MYKKQKRIYRRCRMVEKPFLLLCQKCRDEGAAGIRCLASSRSQKTIPVSFPFPRSFDSTGNFLLIIDQMEFHLVHDQEEIVTTIIFHLIY